MNQLIHILKKYRDAFLDEDENQKKKFLKDYENLSTKTTSLEDDFLSSSSEDEEDEEEGEIDFEDVDEYLEIIDFVESIYDSNPRLQKIAAGYIQYLHTGIKVSYTDVPLFKIVAEGQLTPEIKRKLDLYDAVDLAFTSGKSESERKNIMKLLDELRDPFSSYETKQETRRSLGVIKYKKKNDVVEFADYAKLVLGDKNSVDVFFSKIEKFYKKYNELFIENPDFTKNIFDLFFDDKNPEIIKVIDEIKQNENIRSEYSEFNAALISFQGKFADKIKNENFRKNNIEFVQFKLIDFLNSGIFSENLVTGNMKQFGIEKQKEIREYFTFERGMQIRNKLIMNLIHVGEKVLHTMMGNFIGEEFIATGKVLEIKREIEIPKGSFEIEYEISPDGTITEFRPKESMRILGETLPNRLPLLKELPKRNRNLNAPNFGTVGYVKNEGAGKGGFGVIPKSDLRKLYHATARRLYPGKFKTMFDAFEEFVVSHYDISQKEDFIRYIQDITTPLIFLTQPLASFEASLKNLLPFYQLYDCSKFVHKFDIFEYTESEEDRNQVIEYTNIIHKNIISQMKYDVERTIDPSIRVAKMQTNISYISSKLHNLLKNKPNKKVEVSEEDVKTKKRSSAALKIQRAFRKKKNVRWSAKLKTSQNYIDYIKSLEKDKCSEIKKKYDKLVSSIDDKYKNYTDVIKIRSSYKKKCK
jgi:hypothetical protein